MLNNYVAQAHTHIHQYAHILPLSHSHPHIKANIICDSVNALKTQLVDVSYESPNTNPHPHPTLTRSLTHSLFYGVLLDAHIAEI